MVCMFIYIYIYIPTRRNERFVYMPSLDNGFPCAGALVQDGAHIARFFSCLKK